MGDLEMVTEAKKSQKPVAGLKGVPGKKISQAVGRPVAGVEPALVWGKTTRAKLGDSFPGLLRVVLGAVCDSLRRCTGHAKQGPTQTGAIGGVRPISALAYGRYRH